MYDPTTSPNRLLFRFSKIMGLLCIATATAPSFCFVTQLHISTAAIVRFALAIVAPLVIGGTGALTIEWRRYSNRPMGKPLVWEMTGLIALLLVWLATLWMVYLSHADLWLFSAISVPFAPAWLLKLGCWIVIAVGSRIAWYRWFDAISMVLSFLAIAAWLAQAIYIVRHGGGNDPTTLQAIILFDALPPVIIGGGMLVAAAVARRRRLRGARLLEFGGLAALFLSVLLTDGVGTVFVSGHTYADLARQTYLFLGTKLLSAIVIGGASWLVRKRNRVAEHSLPESAAGPTGNPVAASLDSRPVRRLPDLLSFLAVLFIWFCAVPIPPYLHITLIIPGPSMFVAGFPVGLVGVVALLAAGLLRAGRDRSRIVALELFGVIALTMVFVAAALPFATNIGAIKDAWLLWLMLLSWVLFGLVMVAKLVCMAAAMIRRRERMQFSLLGLLALMIGCGALAMYWRLWRS